MRMDASRQVFINCTPEEEEDKIEALLSEITKQIHSWGAFTWSSQDLSADAVVALLELRHNAELRRAYLQGKMNQDTLPF